MDTKGVGQKTHDARLSAPSRAALVPQRHCDAEAAPRLTSQSEHRLFKDQGGLHLAVTVPKGETVGALALDLRANPNHRDGSAARQFLHLNHASAPDAET